MQSAATSAIIACVAISAWWYRYGVILTPDGVAYLEIAAGKRGRSPFRWRALPRLLGRLPLFVWRTTSWATLVASTILVGVYAEQRGVPSWIAASLFVTLPWYRGLVRCPILTDQLGMAFALGAALAPWWAAIPLAMLAGSCHERAPVFAAVFAWSPIPLVGLLVPMVAAVVTRNGGAVVEPHNDWRAMRELHNQAPLEVFVWPWGACLLAAMAPSWQLLCAVAAGYATVLVATDRARLYQAGAPVVVVASASALPPWSWPLAVVAMVALPACGWEAPWK